MAEYTECAADIVDAFDEITYANGALLVESTADAADSVEQRLEYLASSTAAASAAAAIGATTIVAAADVVAAADAAEQGFTFSDSSTADAADAAVLSTTLSESSAAAASSSASGTRSTVSLAESEADAVDRVVTVIEHNETSTGNATSSIGVVVELDVGETAGAAVVGAPAGSVAVDVESAAAAADAWAAATTANADATSTAVARAAAVPVDLTYPSMWANSERMASAVWKAVPFESYVVFGGKLIAAGADGIYTFSETEDDTGPISARVVGDLSDLGSNKKKNFSDALVAGKTGGPLRVGVETEMGVYRYVTELPGSTYPTTHRAGIGRGLTGRYVRFSLDNQATGSEGATFAINEVTAGVGDTARVR